MKRKNIVFLLIALFAATSVFASGTGMTTENIRTYNKGDLLYDKSESYLPETRELSLVYTDGSGNILDEFETTLSYEYLSNGNNIKRYTVGDADVRDMVDKFYDIKMIDVFNDWIATDAVDLSFVSETTLDGVSVKNYHAEVALDQNVFFFNSLKSGSIIGYEDGDFNGDVTLDLTLESETGAPVKAVWTIYYNPGVGISKTDHVITVEYADFNIDGEVYRLPAVTTIEGDITFSSSVSGVRDVAEYVLTDTASDYTYVKEYSRSSSDWNM